MSEQAMADGPTDRGTVLVTGAGGFIASHLVEALLARHYNVIGVDRRSPAIDPQVAWNLADPLHRPRFTFVHADLAADGWQHVVPGCHTVFHLAAVPGVRESWGGRFTDYVRGNVLGTQRLLNACLDAGVRRLVYASSSSVYGRTAGASRESDAVFPQSPYGVSKLAGEHLCMAYTGRPDSAMSAVLLRYFTVYGPRQRPDMAITRMLTAALTSSTFELFGDGSQLREFTYVSDVVRATVAAGEAPVTGSTVLNVGGGCSVSVREALNVVEEVVGRPVSVIEGPARAGDVPVTAADLTATRQVLGYEPRVDLPTGMAMHARWIAHHTRSAAALAAVAATGALNQH